MLGVRTEHPQLPEQIDVGEGWQVLDFPGLDWRTDSVAPGEDEVAGALWDFAGRQQDVLIRSTEHGIELRANGADVSVDGHAVRSPDAAAHGQADAEADANDPQDDGIITVQAGQTVTVGHVDFLVQGVVRATLHVRNAFGNVSTTSVEVVLERAARPLEAPAPHAALTVTEPVR